MYSITEITGQFSVKFGIGEANLILIRIDPV